MANVLAVAKQHAIIVLAQLGRSQRQIAAGVVRGLAGAFESFPVVAGHPVVGWGVDVRRVLRQYGS